MGALQLQFLGTGDAFGSGGRFNTCFYGQAADNHFLIDCGATSLVAMKQAGIQYATIDTIFISHYHGDHFGGVPFVVLDRFVLQQGGKPLTIVSPPGGKERLYQLLNGLYPGSADKVMQGTQLHFVSYEGTQHMQVNGYSFSSFPVVHAPESLPHAMRIGVAGKVVAFSGDTEWVPVLPEVAHQADLFICECNYFNKQGAGHINYTQIQKNEHRLAPKQMVLNHPGPDMLANQGQLRHTLANDNDLLIL